MDYQILKQPPIDLVYLWCDDNDKEWNTKRLQYMRREKLLDVQAVHPCRYTTMMNCFIRFT